MKNNFIELMTLILLAILFATVILSAFYVFSLLMY